MFARVSTLFAMFFLGLALMVSATPAALKPVARDTIPASQCNTGDLQCCNTVENVRAGCPMQLKYQLMVFRFLFI